MRKLKKFSDYKQRPYIFDRESCFRGPWKYEHLILKTFNKNVPGINEKLKDLWFGQLHQRHVSRTI